MKFRRPGRKEIDWEVLIEEDEKEEHSKVKTKSEKTMNESIFFLHRSGSTHRLEMGETNVESVESGLENCCDESRFLLYIRTDGRRDDDRGVSNTKKRGTATTKQLVR